MKLWAGFVNSMKSINVTLKPWTISSMTLQIPVLKLIGYYLVPGLRVTSVTTRMLNSLV